MTRAATEFMQKTRSLEVIFDEAVAAVILDEMAGRGVQPADTDRGKFSDNSAVAQHPCVRLLRCAAALIVGDRSQCGRATDAVARLVDHALSADGADADVMERIAALYPRTLDARAIDCAGSRRRRQGSYFTPPAVVDHLLDLSLEPLLDEVRRSTNGDRDAAAESLLNVTVCDPACGVGAFLSHAARRMAHRLLAIRGGDLQTCLTDVTRRCIRGVDADPIAAEITRIILQTQCGVWVRPAVYAGNALLGADRDDAKGGVSDDAFGTQADDDAAALRRVRSRNRRERARSGSLSFGGCEADADDAWVAAFLREPIVDADDRAIITSAVVDRLRCGDADATERAWIDQRARSLGILHWHRTFAREMSAGGFSLMVGNPPFLSQLARATAASRGMAALLRAQSGGAIRRYADLASAFLLLSLRRVRSGGRIAFVLPASIISGRDSNDVRARVIEQCHLHHLWLADGLAFGCGVRPCALVLERADDVKRARVAAVGRSIGHAPPKLRKSIALAGDDPNPLSTVAASLADIPMISVQASGRIGDRALVTADFRDQYYGLRGFVVEDADLGKRSRTGFPALVTTGTIDLAACRWGVRPVRLFGRIWQAPRIDRDRMEREGSLHAWLEQRCVPKLITATQTRLIEVFVDVCGAHVPSVPLISTVPHSGEDPWLIAAAMAAPPVTAHALRVSFGAGMDARALRLSARQIADLPLPGDAVAWQEAANAIRSASEATDECGRLQHLRDGALPATRAFGIGSDAARELVTWWHARLPGGRRRGASEAKRSARIGYSPAEQAPVSSAEASPRGQTEPTL